MRRMPLFRWVLALGLALVGFSLVLAPSVTDFPDLRQIDLDVVDEKPDGECTVRWTDPFEDRERVEPYRCDPDREPILKAPDYDPASGLGWETGFVIAKGPDRGELYSLDEDVPTETGGMRGELSEATAAGGLLLTAVGIAGGGFGALMRASGVNPAAVHRARRLRDAANAVAEDYERALEAVRTAWAPLRRELASVPLESARPGPQTTALVLALQVLVEAGPQARSAAEAGRELSSRLDPLLADAAPARKYQDMLRADRDQRWGAQYAVSELTELVKDTDRQNSAHEFAQASVDLLRRPDPELGAVSAWSDLEARPEKYRSLLAEIAR
ncbi:hypothetical protein ACIBLA_37465 [Streptomyces sp. NPDC050433]|uniref:hypothetical protein n=1 Tax=unclassified Streptomyces TaxID=2593676 RepID=UPI003415666D